MKYICNICDKEVDVVFNEIALEGTIYDSSKNSVGNFSLKLKMDENKKFCKFCLQQCLATLMDHKNTSSTSLSQMKGSDASK